MTVRELITKWGFKIDQGPLDRMDKQLHTLKTGITVIGAAVSTAAVGMFGLVYSVAKAGDEALKTAQRVGLGVEAWQELVHVGNLADVSTGDLSMAMVQLSRRMKDAKEGSKDAMAAFSTLGISVTDQSGAMRSADAILSDMADRFQTMPDGPQKTAMAMELMGRSGTRMIPVLNSGSAEMAKLRQEARDFGMVIDEKTAKQSEVFNDTLYRLKASLLGIRNTIGARLLPAINDILDRMLKWILANRQLISTKLSGFIEGISKLLVVFWRIAEGTANVVTTLISAFGGLEKVLIAVAITFGLIAFSQIGYLTSIIYGLAAAYTGLGWAALFAQIKMLAIPILIGAAIVLLGVYIYDLIRFIQGKTSWLGALVEEIKGWGKSIGDFFVGIYESIKPILDVIGTVAKWFSVATPRGGFAPVRSGEFAPPMKPQPIGPLAATRTTTQNVNVTSNIQLDIPAGTPAEQAKSLEDSAKRIFSEMWDVQLRGALPAFPSR